jgi:hypothetical protein
MKARIGYKEKPRYSTGRWLKFYFEKFTCKVTNQNRRSTTVEPDTTTNGIRLLNDDAN